MKAKYFIDGDGGNNRYDTLADVRHHIHYEPNAYEGMAIAREMGDDIDPNFIRFVRIKNGSVVLSKN